ncbi:ATP-NAD kinase-like domain-containing protein [Kockovaella imperatae]|uniref:ATP-NAD kinase-like domain-containing protein n=1 Tax=Kockovaella imperatae TaxID=4999 RepID=A0A1Y1U9V2_9TREE|nr:ATP-NAD kinase-like domain-containing protein [Kockovaella imperatae]ORX34286.1 ATP-NAD kinase-like domain-containing protein [Kockovaella imperatae]
MMLITRGSTARALSRSIHQTKHVRSIHMLKDIPRPSSEDLQSRPRLLLSSSPSSQAESSSMAQRRFYPSHQLSKWSVDPRTILLIQKPRDERTAVAMGDLLRFLTSAFPHLRIIVEPHTAQDHPEFEDLIITAESDTALLPLHTDLVITLGGDGTILHTSNLFGDGACPPVISFSMGSLGFLLPFHINDMETVLQNALSGPVSVLQRMRLSCTPLDASGEILKCSMRVGESGWQVMNEVAIHRGRHPHLNVVDAYFDGEHLTEAVADGILLSTPTGSTAYSLSAGGPISHPDTDAFLLTPIAPRSLSFRTVILPGRGVVQLKISPLARSPAELSFDGREVCLLNPDESVIITKSPFPIPCIERGDGGAASGWVKDINSLLQFNTGFRNKSVMGHGIS